MATTHPPADVTDRAFRLVDLLARNGQDVAVPKAVDYVWHRELYDSSGGELFLTEERHIAGLGRRSLAERQVLNGLYEATAKAVHAVAPDLAYLWATGQPAACGGCGGGR